MNNKLFDCLGRVMLAFLCWFGVAGCSKESRDVVFPVAGRSQNAAIYSTDLWLTNSALAGRETVTVDLLESGQTNLLPRSRSIEVPPGETRVLENVTGDFLQRPGIVGALRVRSSGNVGSSVMVDVTKSDAAAPVPSLWYSGIRVDEALRAGGSAVLHGATIHDSPPSGYTIYAVEIHGHPLSMLLELRDRTGRLRGRRNYFLRAYEHLAIPMSEIARVPDVEGVIHVRHVNGDGRIVAMGVPSDRGRGVAWALLATSSPERSEVLSGAEAAAYLVVILLLVFAMFRR